MAHGLLLIPEAAYDCHVITIHYCLGGTSVNVLGIAGIILVILGLLIFFEVGALQFIVGLVFVAAGAYLAARGFGVNLP